LEEAEAENSQPANERETAMTGSVVLDFFILFGSMIIIGGSIGIWLGRKLDKWSRQ